MPERLPDPSPRLDPESWADLYERLSPLGKARLVAETGIMTASSLLDRAVHYAADFVVHTERAFKQGLDSDIEDAKIIDESVSRTENRGRD